MQYTFSAVARSGLIVLGALAGTSLPAFAGPVSVPNPIIPSASAPDSLQPQNAEPSADGNFDGMVQLVRDGGWHGGGGAMFMPHGGGWHGGGWNGGGWHGGGWHGGGWHGGGWHGHGGCCYGGWGGGAFALGLGLGLAAPLYAYGPYDYYGPYNYDPVYVQPHYVRPHYAVRLSSAHIHWCYNRYRSYSVYTNSFQPNYGPRRQCLSPYG